MEKEPLYEMTGTVEHIVFRNDKNQYTVLEVSCGDEGLVTVVGTFPFVSPGEELHIYGTWSNHPTFGPQFKAETFEHRRPATAAAMLRYLSSGAVKGIGPATAGKIIELFGENTLDVIANDPERLSTVKGITKEKARKISLEMNKVIELREGIRELLLYTGVFGINPEDAIRVWKRFGSASIETIRENPYCLCEDSLEISFDCADAIAASMERPQDDAGRIRAGIVHVLRHNLNNGHTCLPADKLTLAASHLLGVEEERTQEELVQLCACGALIAEGFSGKAFVFLPKLYRAESYAAERLDTLLRFPAQVLENAGKRIREIERETGFCYAEKQREAILCALEKGMLILTGGPGTGKTTTLNAIIRILKERGEEVLLAAPTGRAAKRMSELTGEEAKTIHRMLQVSWDEQDLPVFNRNEHNPLECDALVIDELSMVDAQLFEGVLRALPLGCRLVLVGDSDQLPSVGAGNVLGDLIASKRFPTVELKEIFRQSRESLIVTNAHAIVNGQMPDLSSVHGDCFFMGASDPAAAAETIVSLCASRLPRTYGYSPFADIQVLCPGRKGELGVYELNKKLQAALNPEERGKKQINLNGIILREGDKVMQVRNDYDIPWQREDGTAGEGVFNGDIGLVLKIDRNAGNVTVWMDDRYVVYETEQAMRSLELAYAVTIHKSQGNEFPAVIIPVLRCPMQLSYRNLLYTGVTRAKSTLILIGQPGNVRQMVENDKRTRRYTALKKFLLGENEQHEPFA